MKTPKIHPVRLCLLLILSYWIASFGSGFIFMKEIKLTQGKVALVDDEDYDFINQWKWMAHKRKFTFYAVRTNLVGEIKGSTYMHRAILKLSDRLILADHKDGDGLNNQKSNLRECNCSQNFANRRKTNDTTSTFKGVHFISERGKFVAYIKANKKRQYLGYFKNEIDAAAAYNKKAKELFGEFAKLNQI